MKLRIQEFDHGHGLGFLIEAFGRVYVRRMKHPLSWYRNWRWHQDPRHRCHLSACGYCK
jgi:hypothetical protein